MAWVRFRKKDMPGGLWTKCPRCGEMIFSKELLENFKVCKKCSFHMTTSVDERIQFTCDADSFEELYADLAPVDRLAFTDKTTYEEKLKSTARKTGRLEGMTIGIGRVLGREVVLGVMNFQFLGGSMGVVVGEKVTLAVELAMERDLPLVLICASGGARMHEGALSLMQMAKTCAALARLSDAGEPYIALLTDPTTGGVTASFATMADVILAEPEALIGFAGPRVIQNTIRQELPPGFQRSEFLLGRGQIDRIVRRDEVPQTLSRILGFLKPLPDERMLTPPPRLARETHGKNGNGAHLGKGLERAEGASDGDAVEGAPRLPPDSPAPPSPSGSSHKASRKDERRKKKKK